MDAIRNLMAHLGNIQDQLNVIHIAGTNGKGSVGIYISAILSAQGYRTGTYASPAVFDDREIMKVDGQQIPEKDFAEIMSYVHKACEQMHQEGEVYPSAFEAETAAAFCYFKQQKCDFAVVEAGLGGRTDATNIISRPICSVFTSISMDHMAFLGDTLEEIAAEKAGIMKPGCPCVSAVQKPKVLEVLKNAAARTESLFYVGDGAYIRQFQYDGAGSSFFLDWRDDSEDGRNTLRIHSSMAGAFQKENFACALEVVRVLQGMADKEYKKVLQATLPYASCVFTVTPPNPRALDGKILAGEAVRFYPKLKVCYVPDIRQAAAWAVKEAGRSFGIWFIFFFKAIERGSKGYIRGKTPWMKIKSNREYACCWKAWGKTRSGKGWSRRRNGLRKCIGKFTAGLCRMLPYLWLRRFQRKILILCWKKILHFFLLVNIICCRFMERRMWHIFRTERSLA